MPTLFREQIRIWIMTMGLAAAVLAGCTVENPAHCGNNGGHEACRDPQAPWCDECVAANDGCVAGNVRCEPAQSMSTTSAADATSSTTGDPTSSDENTGSGADSSTGPPSVCGDGMIQGEERCDPPDYGGFDCQQVGLGGGELGCDPDCSAFDLSQCAARPECGNGTREGNEQCDGEDLGNANCAMLAAFISGTLACGDDCSFDTSACDPCHGSNESCASDAECCSGVCSGVIIGELLGKCE